MAPPSPQRPKKAPGSGWWRARIADSVGGSRNIAAKLALAAPPGDITPG
ncbi:MAG: hypothetical protein LBP92_11235 [Deltaproteobacteria bacterium]|nr:hypothetical protein [Deltaproteobacteria bacterium]